MNCGSTSVKGEIIDLQSLKTLAAFRLNNVKDYHKAIGQLIKRAESAHIAKSEIKVIGHRVVHGGNMFHAPLKITPANLRKLSTLNSLAPLHNPHNVEGIKACISHFKNTPNIAVFDTEFFHDLPINAKLYGLPFELYKKHKIQKYGFHGISNEYICDAMAKKLDKKNVSLIVCHLGGGASITAIENGKPIDTSMGFTPNEGVMMATRSGDINPDIIFYLMNVKKWSAKKIQQMLEHKSGLLGVSQKSSDMLHILKLADGKNKSAIVALDLFCYKISKYIASYMGLMKSVDCIVFTAGIGENSFVVKRKIMENLPGIKAVKTCTMVTEEAQMIARKIRTMV